MRALAARQSRSEPPQHKRSTPRGETASPAPTATPPTVRMVQRSPACACGDGCSRCGEEAPVIQTKLKISRPGDRYEQEAESVAKQVMPMADPQLQSACACGGGCPKHRVEQQGQEHASLQTRPVGSNVPEQTAVPPMVNEVLRSPGQPLDPEVRAFMELRLGHDLSQVRVHTDTKANESARAINALSYTVGRDVVFGEGQYTPGTVAGRRLLAHELAHTIQQTSIPRFSWASPQRPLASIRLGPINGAAETEAQSDARQVVNEPGSSPVWPHAAFTNAPLLLQRRTLREEYVTAAYETGPLWDVTLTITGAPDRNNESLIDFINACMDGITGVVNSLGSGRGALSRHIRVRIRYRRRFDYVTVEHEAFAAARRSVMRERPQETMQQEPQPRPGEQQAPAAQPAPTQPKTIIVIGSPSPRQAYGFQFVSAALCHPNDRNTIWLVEHSGYEMIYGTSPGFITDQAPAGGYGWITSSQNLLGRINSMPDRSVGRLVVYSHGVPGLVALRYGWSSVGMPDYGLNLQHVARLSPSKFTPDATIEFNSCNTGTTTGEGNLAQAFANQADRPVRAWTGRTSYAGINRGACRVQGSRYALSTDAISEFWSRLRAGTTPQLRTFTPLGGTTP